MTILHFGPGLLFEAPRRPGRRLPRGAQRAASFRLVPSAGHRRHLAALLLTGVALILAALAVLRSLEAAADSWTLVTCAAAVSLLPPARRLGRLGGTWRVEVTPLVVEILPPQGQRLLVPVEDLNGLRLDEDRLTLETAEATLTLQGYEPAGLRDLHACLATGLRPVRLFAAFSPLRTSRN